MRIKNFFFLSILCLIGASSLIFAQEHEINSKFGLYGGYNFNIHSGDFHKLADVPNCCKKFESGSGSGFNIGGLFEYRLTSQFWLGARVGIMTLDGKLTSTEETTIIILNIGPASGEFEHILTGKFMNVALEPMFIYNPISDFNISIGARIGTNITATYEQMEKISQPENLATFANPDGTDSGERIRNEFSGDLPESVALQLHAFAMLSYELPLNKEKSLRLAPELAYYLPLSENASATSWQVSPIRIGLALKYSYIPKAPKEEIFNKEVNIDTIEVKSDMIAKRKVNIGEPIFTNKSDYETDTEIIITEHYNRTDTLLIPQEYKLLANIDAIGVDDKENELTSVKFIIEEYVSNRLDPLLNYIFFDDNSSKLPVRYNKISKNEASKFAVNSLFYNSTIEIYYNLLNIIGLRMLDYPEATLNIKGYNSGVGSEKSNINLSEERANAVRNYLIDVWAIAPARLLVQKNNLPEKPSTPIEEELKMQENRRVELYSSNDKILAPLFIEKVDRSANPPIIRFKLSSEAEAGLDTWVVSADYGAFDKKRFVKEGKAPLPEFAEWELAENQAITPDKEQDLKYRLAITDKKGNEFITDDKEIPIEILTLREKRAKRQGDYEIEKFGLILFDFDKANISATNKKITDFIKDRIKAESSVEIKGYSDMTGDEQHNLKLALSRAESTNKALGAKNSTVVEGIGEAELLYSNDVPEGRFYCRTILIIVKTKVE